MSTNTEPRPPMALLDAVRAAGYFLRVRDGQLVGSKNMPPALKAEVKEQRYFLIGLLANACLFESCNQPLREKVVDDIRYAQCPVEPVHFALAVNLRRERETPVLGKCKGCDKAGLILSGYCETCWMTPGEG